MEKHEKILIIRNPCSGKIPKDFSSSIILKKLRKHFKFVSILDSNTPSHGGVLTRQGLADFDVIAAFGGDGTINSVASALVDSHRTLGIIPGGSGNGLARNLNIPLLWEKAIDVLINGRDVYLDVGIINGRYFFNVAGIGLDGLVSKKFNLESKSRGIFPYVYNAFKGYFQLPAFSVKIKMDNREFQDQVLLITLANVRQYGGNVIIAPFASPFDRMLDICIIKKFNLFTSGALIILRLFTGNVHKSSCYQTYKFEEVEIKSLDGEIPFHFDGEYGGEDLSDFRIRVLPQRIRVRIPAFI